jgi:ribosomal protein S18 acetylase RimI-like enzyme
MSQSEPVELEPLAENHLAGVVSLCEALRWPSYADPSIARAALSAPGTVTWVAVSRGNVIGLVHVLTNGLVHAHLSLIGVLPAYRRRGVARELVTKAFRSTGGKWLDLCSEPGSEAFYRSFVHKERSGFRIHPGEPVG